MKRFLRYIIHNRKKIIKALVIGAVAVGVFVLARKVGTAERGTDAIGGEIFIPLLIIFAEDIFGMIKEPFKAVKEGKF